MRVDILVEAKRLGLQERIQLVEAIWDSVAEDATIETLPLPDAHRDELERRLLDRSEHPQSEAPWDEVVERLEKR